MSDLTWIQFVARWAADNGLAFNTALPLIRMSARYTKAHFSWLAGQYDSAETFLLLAAAEKGLAKRSGPA